MPAVSGTVKDANGNFARRLVRVHRRDNGALVGETLSDPSTGAWSVTTADTSMHYAIAHDSDAWITYLPMNGTNGSTMFTEWGGKSGTVQGNAQLSTAQSKFGVASALFDGSGDYLSIAHNETLNLSSGDFTIEAWIYRAVSGAQHYVVDKDGGFGSSHPQYNITITSGDKVLFLVGTGNGTTSQQTITGTTNVTSGTWHHVAVTRSGTTLRVFLDGSLEASATQTATMVDGGKALLIGYSAGQPASHMSGYIDDLLITKGVARYVADFTPPTAPYSDNLSQMRNARVFDFLTPV